ncbi:MAG: phosphatidylserine decarboxylase family protein [Proteobacteria bacterium]|nr:phosphatidylserine decarboxylase family protein [Pseudomonadota bacterium]
MHKKFFFFCSEGLTYINGLLIVCILFTVYSIYSAHTLLMVGSAFLWLLFFEFCYFFRDPERLLPQDTSAIVAPADGRIIDVQPMQEDAFLHGEALRISIFMNIFDVHVNRAPIAGKIEYLHYNPGKFISAFKEKASLDNEQVAIGINGEGKGGQKISVLVKLIAGLIARRIVLWKADDDLLTKGERISIIKFGSRVDLYLPLEAGIKVKKGDRVKAGETVVATFNP